MNLSTLLSEKQMTMYRLSKLSGVAKTTVLDICSGKSEIGNCNAKTVFQLAKTLGCSMEDLMRLDTSHYDMQTGLPEDMSYLEKGLPPYLEKSLAAMRRSWEIKDNGGEDIHWDLYWCELNADINSAENERSISRQQAWYLRDKYLRTENEI